MDRITFKCIYIEGLSEFVITELQSISGLHIQSVDKTAVYCTLPTQSDARQLNALKTITAVYILASDTRYNPKYLANHKSLLGTLVEFVLQNSDDVFRTYRLSCAGSNSPEVISVENYIREHFKLEPAIDADLDVALGKHGNEWQLSVRTTNRPLSVRPYRATHIPGGMNPTIAYALNSLCSLDRAQSYLNVCSGSGTLLIEAGLAFPHLNLVGFDIDGKHNALAVQNIKNSGLIKRIQLKTANLYDKPDLGQFDVIVADLPFGMQIAKGQDLEELYQAFIQYCEHTLTPEGRVGIFTPHRDIVDQLLEESKLDLVRVAPLKIVTSVQSYLHSWIMLLQMPRV